MKIEDLRFDLTKDPKYCQRIGCNNEADIDMRVTASLGGRRLRKYNSLEDEKTVALCDSCAAIILEEINRGKQVSVSCSYAQSEEALD